MASEYKIAIHIAGELEKSFGSSIQGAQQGIASLAGGKILGGIKTLGRVAVNSMVAAGAAIGAAGVYSVNTGREFEAAMSSTAATAGASAEEYERLRDAAMEMGRTTSKTATESAQALEYMSLAGWSVDDSIASLPGILRLSEASGMDLARTSDLVTDSMSATGTSIGELDTYLDICARAQNKSNQTAEQMMEAYIGVGGVLNNLGVPLTESGAALGVLANRGIKGSEAGTALNAIMTNLTTGTGQAGKAMEAIGVSAFDSEGNFIGLEETLRLVNDATKDMTEEERNATLAAIGGKHHVKDLNALMAGLNETNEDGVSEWNALEGELQNSKGALETMAETKLDNLNGDLAILTSSLQDLGIRGYELMQGPLRGAVQWATDEVYKLSDAMTEGGFDGFASTLGEVLSDAVVQVATYAPQFVEAATTLISSFLTGITDNADQIGEGAAQTAGALIIGLIQTVPQLITTGLVLLKSFLAGIETQLPTIIEKGKEGAQNLITGIQENLPQIITSGINIILQLWQGMGTILPLLIVGGAQIIGEVLSGIGQRMPEIITAGVQMTGQILVGLVQGLPYIIQGGMTLIVGLAEGIIQNLPTIIQTAITIIQYLVDTFVQNLPQILTIGMLILLQLAQGIAENIPTIVQAGIDIIGKLGSAIIENLPTILVYGAQIIGTLAIGILQGIATLITSIPSLIGQLAEAIFEIDWGEVGTQMLEGIKAGFMAAWDALVSTVTDAWVAFKAQFFGGGETSSGDTLSTNWYETTNQRTGEVGYAQMGDSSGMVYTREQAIKAGGLTPGNEKAQEKEQETTNAVNAAKQKAEESAAAAQQWKPDFGKMYKSGEEAGTEYGNGITDSIMQNAQQQADAMSQTTTQGATQSYDDMIAQLQAQVSGGTGLQQVGSEAGTQVGNDLQESINTALASLGSGQGATVDTASLMSGLTSGMSTEGSNAGQQLLQSFNQGTANLPADLTTTGTSAMEGLNGAVEAGGAQATGTAQTSASQVVAAFEGLSGSLFSSGRNAIQGFVNGMNSMAGAVQATAASIAQAAANTINNALKIGSPSKLLEQTGAFTGEGFAQGLAGTEGMIREAASDAIGGVTGQTLTGNRSSVIGSTMQSMGKQITQPESGAGGTMTVTYAPTYQITGNGLTKDDVVKAGRITQSEFEKMMKQYTKNQGRLAFA